MSNPIGDSKPQTRSDRDGASITRQPGQLGFSESYTGFTHSFYLVYHAFADHAERADVVYQAERVSTVSGYIGFDSLQYALRTWLLCTNIRSKAKLRAKIVASGRSYGCHKYFPVASRGSDLSGICV